MDYKKKYEEALERGSRLWESDSITREAYEYMFPELKESEDESIRKEILSFLKEFEHDHYRNIDFSSWISWLEKQGDQKQNVTDIISDLENYFATTTKEQQEKDWDEIKNWEEKHFNHDRHIEQKPSDKVEPKPYFYCKYGGTTPLCSDCKRNHNNSSFKTEEITTWYVPLKGAKYCMDYIVLSEKQVVPKFKVGDWCIDNEDDTIYQIMKVLDNTYTYKTNEGKEYSCSHFSIENEAHLWTIQDAKDGDVLKEDSCIFIIERMKTNGTAIVHCCLFDDGDFDSGSNLSFDIDSTYPATKEQRDFLFQKMKEAGYEWDAEKKELKKIEQNPAWSEEDEEMFDTIIADIQFTQKAHTHEVNQVVYEREIDWLKSIKERYSWKPSKEQMEALLKLEEMHVLEHEKNQENAHLYMVIKSLKEQLFKLKGE